MMTDRLSHYCGSNVFLSFIQKKELWLTSLMQSNDSMEGTGMRSHWLNRLPDTTPQDKLIKKGLATCLNVAWHEKEALGVCFSEERDLLSQWRGYANDGAGFSITFDRAILEKIPRKTDLVTSLSFSKYHMALKTTPKLHLLLNNSQMLSWRMLKNTQRAMALVH